MCAPDTSVRVVIELDDRTHEADRRRRADATKTAALAAAGIKLLRWNVAALPSDDEIKAAIPG
jgi:very-short-patch-repair endonuclease